MTENNISSVPLPQQGISSETDCTQINSPEGDPPNIKSICTNPSTIGKTVSIEKCSSAYPIVSYQQTELPITEQAEVCDSPVSATPQRSLASEVLEKARTRFDMFWGKSKPSPEDSNQ